MRFLLWVMLISAIVGCATPLPTEAPVAPMPSPLPDFLKPEIVRKVGPDLRRHLLQRGRQALEAPESVHPVTVVIQARRDITEELESQSAKVRSVTQNGVVVITADVPLTSISDLLSLPDIETIELTQPVSPAEEDGEWRIEK